MKVHLLFFILVVFFASFGMGFSQNSAGIDNIRVLADSGDDDSTKIQSLLKISRIADGQPIEGLMAAREALVLAEENDLLFESALAYQELALIYRKLGNYSKAIENSFSALKLFDQLKLSKYTAAMQLQIGSHYINDNNFDRGIFYISQAMETFRERKDTFNIALTLVNLGETYRLKGELDSATSCFRECLRLNKSLKNEQIEGYGIGNLGMVYVEQDRLQGAIEVLNTSIEILSEMDDVYSVSVYQSQLANVFIRLGHKNKGEQLLKTSLEMARNQKLKEQIRDINKDLAEFYEDERRFEQSLQHRKQFEIYHDSLVNIDNVRNIEQVESQYWLDLKEADIRFLEESNRFKKNVVRMLSAGFVILLILLFFLYRLQLSRKRAYQKVSDQKTIIEKREQEKALLLKELNHRVKNNLQMVSSMFSLQAGQLRGSPAADALTVARGRIDALMLIHQKLYRENVDTQVALSDYIGDLINSLVYSFDKKVNLYFDLMPVYLQIDSAIPLGIVINELITNSLKYAPAGRDAELSISVKQNGQTVSVMIADNGPGLPDDPDIQQATSMGLKLVSSLVRQLHGEIKQTNDHGCRWEIFLEV
jgi:two-component sensor histidine kinase